MDGRKPDIDYVQLLLVDFCLPTLFGIKPSSLVSVNKHLCDRNTLIHELEIQINPFSCQCTILYENNDMANLFIYNEKLLNKLISCDSVQQFLVSCGYRFYNGDLTDIFDALKIKIKQFHNSGYKKEACFPHEIGILLGYPLEDVEDFIRFHGNNYILCGCWKVYHNAGEALKTFDSYRKIRQSVIDKLNKGVRLKDITNM